LEVKKVMNRTLTLTTPHMKGQDVETAQRLLTKHGDYEGPISREYDVLTAQASYQAQFRLGYARPAQGFGTPLEKLLKGEAKPTAAMKKLSAKRQKSETNVGALRKRALAEMIKLIGTVENPPHSNHTVVGKFYGVQDEWCAMTVTMAYVKAGSTGFARGSRWAYVPFLVAAARAGQYGLSVTMDPKPGDLVCYDLDGSNFNGSKNHIGMFEKRTGPRSFQTIEGNIEDTCKRMQRSLDSNFAKRYIFVRVSK
jgi:CHAP domain